MQVRYILNMAERFVRQFDEEDGEGGIGRHMRYINCDRVEQAHGGVALDNRDYACGLGESCFYAAGEQWKLDDDAWWLRRKYLHGRGELVMLHHLSQCLRLEALIANLPACISA